MIICDTSIIIDFLRRQDKLATWLYQLQSENQDLSISLISLTEIYSGKSVWEKPEIQFTIDTILKGLQIIPVSTDIAKEAGKIRSALNTNPIDAIIAQTAISYNSYLATFNTKHFSNIPQLHLLPHKTHTFRL